MAAGTRAGLEPELVVAIDPLVPTAPLIDSLQALGTTFPGSSVRCSTEGLGGSLRRLQAGTAAIGICLLLPSVPDNIASYPLLRIRMVPVIAPGHPLATLGRPATPEDLAPHVQLVLSDPVDAGGADDGLSSARLWRFVDLGRRLDFALAGLGWCRMPEHLVAPLMASGRLQALPLAEGPTPREGLTICAAHKRSHTMRPAGNWLLDDLRKRLSV